MVLLATLIVTKIVLVTSIAKITYAVTTSMNKLLKNEIKTYRSSGKKDKSGVRSKR